MKRPQHSIFSSTAYLRTITSCLFLAVMSSSFQLKAQQHLDEVAGDTSIASLKKKLQKRQDSVDFMSFEGKYNEAISLSIDNIALAEKIGDSGAAYYSRYSIAILHLYLEDYDKMLSYVKPYKEYAIRNKDSMRMGRAYNLEGSAYITMKDYEKGIPLIEKSIPLFKALKDTLQTTIGYYNLSESYLNKNDVKSARMYFDSTTTSLNSMKGFKGLTSEYNLLAGSLKMIDNNYAGALQHFNESISFGERAGYVDMYVAKAYKGYSEALFEMGKTKEAYHAFSKYDSINKVLYEESKVKMIKNATTKFDTEHYKAEAIQAALKNELNEERLKNQKVITLFLIGFILVVLMLFLVYFFKKKKRNQPN